MPPIPFADNFLAGAILSLALPAGLLIALVIWYAVSIKRIGETGSSGSQTPPSSAPGPGPVPPAAAGPAGAPPGQA
jgi:hypothetical protein